MCTNGNHEASLYLLFFFLSMSAYTVCMWSGGKDSTASIICDHFGFRLIDGQFVYDRSVPCHRIDEIIFAEVMYDNSKQISAELPNVAEWLTGIAIPLFRSWGYKVTVLRDNEDFLSLFNRRIEKAPKNPDHVGKRRGFPVVRGCWAKRDLKLRPINRYMRELEKDFDAVLRVVGICSDEPRRLQSLAKTPNSVSFLAEANIAEADCFRLCNEYGLLSPVYSLNNQRRGGCFFCPWSKPEEHRLFARYYPEAYEQFVMLEKQARVEGDVSMNLWNPFIGPLSEHIYR